MLRRVECVNFSLLREVRVELGPGLTVLTGASGAGKTLLFDAVAFALGGRASRGLLPKGASSGSVTLVLDMGIAPGAPWQSGENVVVRRLSSSGAGRITLNGQAISAIQLQEPAIAQLEVTGQFESRVLFDSRSHLGLLESFGDEKLHKLRYDYVVTYQQHNRVQAALNALRESAANRAQEVDFLTFQVEELSKANVQPGERLQVESQLKLQQNAQELVSAASTAARLLSGEDDQRGAYDLAAAALKSIERISAVLGEGAESSLEHLHEQGAEALELLTELAQQLREFAHDVHYEPALEEQLSDRLDEILRLERKYGVMSEEIAPLLEQKQERLAVLTDATQNPETLERELAELGTNLQQRAEKLSKARESAAKKLVETARGYLLKLDFPDVQFEVEIRTAERLGPSGADIVEFMVSLNPGEPPRALAQVASGGEASRLFLALKAALADRLGTRVMLLDEVEAGLGGDTAKKVADVLIELASGGRQVIAITHLPAVAARGQHHLLVSKEVAGGRTSVNIQPVSGNERQDEMLRMLGEDTSEARRLVKQMLAT
jgi:DNA repair protein RecN (Recombination protein N)